MSNRTGSLVLYFGDREGVLFRINSQPCKRNLYFQ